MITFDFDDTLTCSIWDEKKQFFEFSENPNYDAFAKLKEFHEKGREISIVTTRWSC